MKLSRAERMIGNSDDDVIVIMNGDEPFLDSAFWYVTEQSSGTFEGGLAIIQKDGTLDVVASILEEEIARQGKGEVHVYHNRDERKTIVRQLLGGAKRVGVNTSRAPYAYVSYLLKVDPSIEIVDAGKAIDATVAIKDEKEIAAMEKACQITSKVASELPSMIRVGISEREVASQMDIRMRELGASGNAFDTIAAFGKYSAEPHHMPCDYKLQKGDTALFDFGAKYDRYCADLTRTIFLGDPGETMKKVYDIVKRSQEVGISKYRDGAPAKDADVAAREIIDATEFKGRFIHSFGHGIGMDVHEAIYVYPKSDQTLHSGNVVSAEPGIYVPGVGGVRIEDSILITDKGSRALTSYDHAYTQV
jgi:Xaa-Pro dipeptidase